MMRPKGLRTRALRTVLYTNVININFTDNLLISPAPAYVDTELSILKIKKAVKNCFGMNG